MISFPCRQNLLDRLCFIISFARDLWVAEFFKWHRLQCCILFRVSVEQTIHSSNSYRYLIPDLNATSSNLTFWSVKTHMYCTFLKIPRIGTEVTEDLNRVKLGAFSYLKVSTKWSLTYCMRVHYPPDPYL